MKSYYKLNLGCGELPKPGFINIDIVKKPGVDIVMDVRYTLPLKDEEVEEIYSHHLIEHIEINHFKKMLKDWHRLLKEDGTVEINTPDLEGIMDEFMTTREQGRKEELLKGIIAYTNDPSMIHHYVYWFDKLKELLEEAGFKNINVYYMSQCNCPAMKVTCRK